MSEKILTLISTASMDQYPNNTISDFRCKLHCPISLNDGNWEVALTSLSYFATETVAYEGENIATYFDGFRNRNLIAPFSIRTLRQLFSFINANTNFQMRLNEYGYVTLRRVSTLFSVIKFSERMQYLLGIWEYAPVENGRYKNRKKYIGKTLPFSIEDDIPEHINKVFEKFIEDQNLQYTSSITFSNEFDETIQEDDTYDPEKESKMVKEENGIKLYSNSGNLFCRKGDQYIMKAGELLWKDLIDNNQVECPRHMSVIWDFYNALQNHGIILAPNYNGKAMLIFPEGEKISDYEFSDKFKEVLGFTDYCVGACDESGSFQAIRGKHRPYVNMGKSKLFVYCDLITPQFVGDAVAPLLMSTPVQYGDSNHVVMYPSYLTVNKQIVDVIHLYIRCENGEPPPFELGSFTVTLSLRRNQN